MIHMLQNFKDISFLVGDKEKLGNIKNVPVLPIFDEKTVDFLAELSNVLLRCPEAKRYPDVISFAFWIRKSSLRNIMDNYVKEHRVGRGVAFHIAPSNIPVQFAVTLVYGLIAGNASIIRISDKNFEQVDILCKAINDLLAGNYRTLAPYIVIIRYGHNDEITQALSELCDARIIWGGNNTINTIGKIPVQPRTVELKFADRYSIMVINADKYLEMDSAVIANDFYTDTYWVDQNACSSPRIIVWTGIRREEAKEIFWSSVQKLVEEKYTFNEISGSEKLLRFTLLASQDGNIRMIKKNNKLIRVAVNKLYPEMFYYKGNSGYFFEYDADNLSEISAIMTKECQTVVCCGVDNSYIRSLIIDKGLAGGDRVVNVGHALDLSFCWDGYDMVRELSRIIM